MNCQETRKLFEDALDRRLSGGVKRKLDLHLARCRDCRKFYEAEQAEHARWFRAMNDTEVEPPHSLPPDFADRLVTAVLARNKARVPFFRRFRLPRWAGLAATLALLAAAFAAIHTGELSLSQYAEEPASENNLTTGGTSDQASRLPDGNTSDWDSRHLGGTETTPSTTNYQPPTLHSSTLHSSTLHSSLLTLNSQQGSPQVQTSTIKQAAALTGAIALAAAQPAAADDYQYIISGYPAANECRVARSTGIALETGSYRRKGLATDLEARYRTRMSSLGIALNTTEYRAMVIIMR